MPEPIIALLMAVGVSIGIGVGIAQARRSRRVFTEAADLLGVPQTEIRGWVHMRMEGQMRAFPFKVHEESRGKSGVWTVVEVDSRGRIPDTFYLGREGIGSSFGKLFVGEDIATGDERFDAAVVVRGPTTLALSLLDEETRRRVTDLTAPGGKVKDGVVSIALHRRFKDGKALAKLAQDLVAVAERLAQKEPPVERLSAIARFDAASGARHRALQELIAGFASEPLARETLRLALSDRAPEVRLLAAVALGEQGLDCLRGIVDSSGTAPEVALRAVEALGQLLPEEVALKRLEAAVRAGHDRLAQALVERFGPATSQSDVARLARQLEPDSRPEIAAACARALGRTGSPAAEPPLVAALSHADGDVRAAAAEALGKVGSVGTIGPLREAVADSLLSPSVRRAAIAAIAEIQSRLTGAAPGQLALSEGEAGAVAIADRQEGGVSIAEPSSGGLSLNDEPQLEDEDGARPGRRGVAEPT